MCDQRKETRHFAIAIWVVSILVAHGIGHMSAYWDDQQHLDTIRAYNELVLKYQALAGQYCALNNSYLLIESARNEANRQIDSMQLKIDDIKQKYLLEKDKVRKMQNRLRCGTIY